MKSKRTQTIDVYTLILHFIRYKTGKGNQLSRLKRQKNIQIFKKKKEILALKWVQNCISRHRFQQYFFFSGHNNRWLTSGQHSKCLHKIFTFKNNNSDRILKTKYFFKCWFLLYETRYLNMILKCVVKKTVRQSNHLIDINSYRIRLCFWTANQAQVLSYDIITKIH